MHYKIQYYILKFLHPFSEIICINIKNRQSIDFEYFPSRYTVYYNDKNFCLYVRRG